MKKAILSAVIPGLFIVSSAFASIGPNCDQSAACRKIRPAVIKAIAQIFPEALNETNFNHVVPFADSPNVEGVLEEKLGLTRAFEFNLRKTCLISVGTDGELIVNGEKSINCISLAALQSK